MKMRIVWVILLLLIISPKSNAINIDSLLAILPTQKDTSEIITLNELSLAYIYEDIEKGEYYAHSAIKKAHEIGYKKGEIKGLIRLGIVNDIKTHFDSAIACYDLAAKLCIEINEIKGLASCYNNKAMIYSNKGWSEKAIELYIESLKQFEKIDDKIGQGNALNNISVLYNNLYKNKEGLQYAYKARDLFQSINHLSGLGAALNNMALSFTTIKKDSAIIYYKKAIAIKEKLNDLYGLGITYDNLGLELGKENRYEESLYYLDKALAIKKNFDDQYGIAYVHMHKASTYRLIGDKDKQLDNLLTAYKIANNISNLRLLRVITNNLSLYYHDIKNWEKAYEYLVENNLYSDSLQTSENQNKIVEIEATYELEKKNLIIENKEFELKVAEAKVIQSRTQIIFLIVLLISILILVIFIWIILKQQQKNKSIKENIERLKAQEKAIIDAENKERTRFAKDLHDGAGQLLSAVKMNLNALPEKSEKINQIGDKLNLAIKEIRAIAYSMMPIALHQNNLYQTIHDFADQFSQSNNLNITVHCDNTVNTLSANTQTNIYRIIQECVNNSIKHAEATTINIQLIQHENYWLLMIEDNGKGFSQEKIKSGIGLASIKSRVSLMKGELYIDSTNGTTITVEIPLELN
ncbi:MAG: sensor histidine kinase [Bacteroidia bacterium]|nr:sensor histidine kinase [Bacteroidia bacterium]